MRLKFLFLIFAIVLVISWKDDDLKWAIDKHKNYNLVYTKEDKIHKKEYTILIEQGINRVKSFFKAPFQRNFLVVIHPNRLSLDRVWQKDWNMPDFKSECWMVASGVAKKMDLISPKIWDKEACEHIYGETLKTQNLITHELVHVYHGQLNLSQDFSDIQDMDWFVEGLATYVSGQCDSLRMAEVKTAIAENKTPKSLNNFWSGKLKYGLSGSIVMYIDKKYGSVKLKKLLPINNKLKLLQSLNTTEEKLLEGWKRDLQK